MKKLHSFPLALCTVAVLAACGSDNDSQEAPRVSGQLSSMFDISSSPMSAFKQSQASHRAGAWFDHKVHFGPDNSNSGDANNTDRYSISIASDLGFDLTPNIGDILNPGDIYFTVQGDTEFAAYSPDYWARFENKTELWNPYSAAYPLSVLDRTTSDSVDQDMVDGEYELAVTNESVGLVTWELKSSNAQGELNDITFKFSSCDDTIVGFNDYTQLNADFEDPAQSRGYAYFHAVTSPGDVSDEENINWDAIVAAGCSVHVDLTYDGISVDDYLLTTNFSARQWYKISIVTGEPDGGSIAITHSVANDWDDEEDVDIDIGSPADRIVDVYASFGTVSEIRGDGSVRSIGIEMSDEAAAQLKSGVHSIVGARSNAMAAIKDDSSVVTWGDSRYGGDSSAVGSQLSSGVKAVTGANSAFAALKDDGSVVTWGYGEFGGDSSAVEDELKSGVKEVRSAKSDFEYGLAFAALKNDGSVVTWGGDNSGGDSSSVTGDLVSGVMDIMSTRFAFAALKDDGSVVAWGRADYAGDSSSVADKLESGVVDVMGSTYAFAALKDDGSVVTWGGNIDIEEESGTVVELTAVTDSAFAGFTSNGSVVAWGHAGYGGDSSAVEEELRSGNRDIIGSYGAFAVLKSNGSVVTWGNAGYGGNSSSVADDLQSGVEAVYSSHRAFAAVKEDGSVVTWGNASYGGDSSAVAEELKAMDIGTIVSGERFFQAISKDGYQSVRWGTVPQ